MTDDECVGCVFGKVEKHQFKMPVTGHQTIFTCTLQVLLLRLVLKLQKLNSLSVRLWLVVCYRFAGSCNGTFMATASLTRTDRSWPLSSKKTSLWPALFRSPRASALMWRVFPRSSSTWGIGESSIIVRRGSSPSRLPQCCPHICMKKLTQGWPDYPRMPVLSGPVPYLLATVKGWCCSPSTQGRWGDRGLMMVNSSESRQHDVWIKSQWMLLFSWMGFQGDYCA